MDERSTARQLIVNGIVQGVGFRPFVYGLARRLGLKGDVANAATGVTIHIEGTDRQVEKFCRELTEHPPPLAHITEIASAPVPFRNDPGFSIVRSTGNSERSTLISPDMSVCQDCLAELFDPNDRRYRYPFINCTNCGPRYTIIDDIPYDRPNTSMKHFTMCRDCQSEYDNPESRRFHAQPNACGVCGPRVALHDRTGEAVASPDPIRRAADLLKAGHILAVKGLGGFHLAVDAENETAVQVLRKRKHREEKPFALMTGNLADVERFAIIAPEERAVLLSARRPIVLLSKRDPNTIAPSVSPRNRYFGVMLPYTPLHYLLLGNRFAALVMTSGNISEEPIAIDNQEAFERLGRIADFFLINDRDIYLRSDDSIVKRTAGATRFLRRSRGYVPTPVFLSGPVSRILACGAELKNTVCLTKGKNAFISQHIGDLENLQTYDFFKKTIAHLERILSIEPEIVAADLHPDYLSTRYAEERTGIEKVQIQHHHAHIVSCMAEHGIDGPVIGLAFDGTGYGTDGTIWGGEVLIAEKDRFARAAHLDPVPMPGAAAAIKEPWRMAVSYLYDAFGESLWDLDLPLLKTVGKEKCRILLEMINREVNSPKTSSLGRLFDGIAALAGLRDRVAFEGQAAMELEMIARETPTGLYDFEWTAGPPRRIPTGPIIRGVIKELGENKDAGEISGKFHATLVRMFCELCEILRRETDLDRVVLSGGVFLNSVLLTGFTRTLEKKGFSVFSHRTVPTNDGGISLGQALAAEAMTRR